MLFKNKSEFVDTLSDQFRVAAKWRKNQSRKYSHDARNAEAAQRLLELKSQISVADEVWQHLSPLVTDPSCLEAISETNRDVAFRKHPADFTAWLENLHTNLTRD